MTKIVTLLQ